MKYQTLGTKSPLPPLPSPIGRTYYLDHNTGETSYQDPRHAATEAKDRYEEFGPLLDGWEEAQDEEGAVYFINHATGETSYVDPRTTYEDPRLVLPEAWELAEDGSGGSYWLNHDSGVTTYEDPMPSIIEQRKADSKLGPMTAGWLRAWGEDGVEYFTNAASGEVTHEDPRRKPKHNRNRAKIERRHDPKEEIRNGIKHGAMVVIPPARANAKAKQLMAESAAAAGSHDSLYDIKPGMLLDSINGECVAECSYNDVQRRLALCQAEATGVRLGFRMSVSHDHSKMVKRMGSDPGDGRGCLPFGWEMYKDDDGIPYFVDTNTEQTSYDDPRVGDDPKDGKGPLPPMWEKKEDEVGRVYFINAHTAETSWSDPRFGMDPKDGLGPLPVQWEALCTDLTK